MDLISNIASVMRDDVKFWIMVFHKFTFIQHNETLNLSFMFKCHLNFYNY